jgi:hypothetical protein
VVEIVRSEKCDALDNGLFSGQKGRATRIDPPLPHRPQWR